jgi:hypothetical protein
MNPIVIIAPLLLVLAGTVTFFMLPIDLPLRIAILCSDLLAAGVVGFILWRRYHG